MVILDTKKDHALTWKNIFLIFLFSAMIWDAENSLNKFIAIMPCKIRLSVFYAKHVQVTVHF